MALSSADPDALLRLACAERDAADALLLAAGPLDEALQRLTLAGEAMPTVTPVPFVDPLPVLRRLAGMLADDAEAVAAVAQEFLAADGAPPPDLYIGPKVFGYGNLETADDITIVVGGMHADVEATTRDAWSLSMTARGLSTAPAAVLTWLDYDVPDWRSATSLDDAEEGGRRLAAFVRRLHLRPDQHVTLVGHSYGSAVVARAEIGGAGAENLVLLGSPGLGRHVERASALHLPKGGRVYAARAPGDLVADTAPLGPDPSSPAFGSTRLKVNAPGRPRVEGHSSYFMAGSEALRNIAAVSVGARPSVQRATAGEQALAVQEDAERRARPMLSIAAVAAPGGLVALTPPGRVVVDPVARAGRAATGLVHAAERSVIDALFG